MKKKVVFIFRLVKTPSVIIIKKIMEQIKLANDIENPHKLVPSVAFPTISRA